MRGMAVCLAGATLLAAGCYSHVDQVVALRAPKDLNCPENRVQVQQRGRGEFVARGCGVSAVYHCHVWDEVCANLNQLAQQRAANEFRCPGPIQVAEMSPHVFQVQGCGQSANYFCEMRDGRASCLAEGAARHR